MSTFDQRSKYASVAAALIATGLAAAFWWQGERTIHANGATFDEPPHLAAGYAYWTTGDFRMNREHPPLLKLWWTLPLVLSAHPPYPYDVAAATDNDHWHVGNAFVYGSGVHHTQLLYPARRMNLALGCAVVLLAGWWAFRIWRSCLAGLAATAFAAADPNLLALSCALSTDVGVSLFALLSAYLLWEYTAAPSRPLLFATGAVLGLMLGSKLSALAMIGGLLVASAAIVLRGGVLTLPGAPTPAVGWTKGSRIRAAVDLAFRLGVVALVVLAATYGFVNFEQWGRGLKFQLSRAAHGDGNLFLCGELSRTGWYHYFLVVLALKLPLGLLAALIAACTILGLGWLSLCPDRSERSAAPASIAARAATAKEVPARASLLYLPPLIFLAAASYSRVDLGIRVILPVLPFLYVIAAQLALPGRHRVGRSVVLVGCVAWAAISGWWAAPYPIAYFNELVDGSVGGSRYVADSNVDWGQGLPALKEYVERERIEVVYLAYFGTDRPEVYGIRYRPLPGYGRVGPVGGEMIPATTSRHVLAVSANHLLGLYLNDPETFAWLRDRSPTAVVGGSIFLFDLTGDEDAIRRLRESAQQDP